MVFFSPTKYSLDGKFYCTINKNLHPAESLNNNAYSMVTTSFYYSILLADALHVQIHGVH